MTSGQRVADERADEFARRLRTGRHFPDTQRHAVEEMVRARSEETRLRERVAELERQIRGTDGICGVCGGSYGP